MSAQHNPAIIAAVAMVLYKNTVRHVRYFIKYIPLKFDQTIAEDNIDQTIDEDL